MIKRALITGASRRLGLILTEHLLREGWEVVALTRRSSTELDKLRCNHLDIVCCLDLNDHDLDLAIKSLSQRYKSLDLVVHNASSYQKDPDSYEELAAFYDAMVKIHMKLPVIINSYFYNSLLNADTNNPNIIHITDIYAENPRQDYALYCSTKAAVDNLNKSYAKKFAPKIRVNSIQPGPVKFLPEHNEATKARILNETLLGFEAGFDPIIKTIQFIIDNPYLTGSTIKVDGGRSIAKK